MSPKVSKMESELPSTSTQKGTKEGEKEELPSCGGESSKRKRKHSSDKEDDTNKTPVKQKRRRKKGNEVIVPDIIHELKEDLDRELDIKAQRNNLTATNVKNMIKVK